jgi:hypothetical protein
LNNIEIQEETLYKENISPDFSVDKSTEITEINTEIFTYELPDLEKIPGEIVLNSLLNGSMDTIKILDSFVENNHSK